MQNDPAIFEEEFRVFQADCDFNNRLMPGALLRMTQQISTDHCDHLGMDRAYYERTQRAYLLAKMTMRWKRVPHEDELLRLTTRPELPRRAVYKRVTEIRDASGEEIGLVDSRWVLIDTRTRHILRRLPEDMDPAAFSEVVDRELPIRFPKPDVLEDAGTAWAKYSYCDINGHLNNTHYADIACDVLPMSELSRPVVEMSVNYHSELPAGEHCTLQRGRLDENRWYVCGSKEDRSCFEAVLTLGR